MIGFIVLECMAYVGDQPWHSVKRTFDRPAMRHQWKFLELPLGTWHFDVSLESGDMRLIH